MHLQIYSAQDQLGTSAFCAQSFSGMAANPALLKVFSDAAEILLKEVAPEEAKGVSDFLAVMLTPTR